MQQSQGPSGVVQITTGGQVYKGIPSILQIIYHNKKLLQPITLVQVASCRVSSSKASTRTVKRRSEVLESVRDMVSGNDSRTQFAAEVNCLTLSQRQELHQKVQLPLVIPADHTLAMKADLAISWTKLRILRR